MAGAGEAGAATSGLMPSTGGVEVNPASVKAATPPAADVNALATLGVPEQPSSGAGAQAGAQMALAANKKLLASVTASQSIPSSSRRNVPEVLPPSPPVQPNEQRLDEAPAVPAPVPAPMPEPADGGVPKMPANWSRGKLIGAGAFGQVYLARDNLTGKLFAVKQVALTKDEHLRGQVASHIKALEAEVKVLRTLRYQQRRRHCQRLGACRKPFTHSPARPAEGSASSSMGTVLAASSIHCAVVPSQAL